MAKGGWWEIISPKASFLTLFSLWSESGTGIKYLNGPPVMLAHTLNVNEQHI